MMLLLSNVFGLMRRSFVAALSVFLLVGFAIAIAAPVYVPLAKDGIHDPANPGLKMLQEPGEALANLPPDVVGNQVFYGGTWQEDKCDANYVLDWKREDFYEENERHWKKGWKLRDVDSYVLDGQVYYNGVWALENLSGTTTSAQPRALVSATLNQNIPNPFNPTTSITFEVERAQDVSLRIFDISGRLVRTLAEGRIAAGPHTAVWNGRNDHGRHLPSGHYICRLRAGNALDSRRLTQLK